MSKTVRVYLSTFIDVEGNPDEFNGDVNAMADYVKSNLSDFITPEELYKNVSEDADAVKVLEW